MDSITHPVINSPYEQPSAHWELDHQHRATSTQLPGRRPSANLPIVPVPTATAQLSFPGNNLVNAIRDAVGGWRNEGYPGVTSSTKRLLTHWTNPLAMRRLFFAQVEALETLIWLKEVAGSSDRGRALRRDVNAASRAHNDDLLRQAVKMATGTGKTAAMGMVIAWHAVNAAGRRAGYRTQFLIVAPGITVRERLATLDPAAAHNVYDELDLVPSDLRKHLGHVQVRVVNFQAFQRRDILGPVHGDTRRLLRQSAERVPESPHAMLERVLRGMRALGSEKHKIVVLNDEAHHCYLPGSEGDSPVAAAPAALWFNALRALRDEALLAEPVYDFSATPMFINTAARQEALMFPWVVSDFNLMDAIESGLVKIPRVPVEDDSDVSSPVWRNLYVNTTPKKLHRSGLHGALDDGLDALYRNYETVYEQWLGEGVSSPMPTPPVFIVVANSIPNAEALFDNIAGYEQQTDDGRRVYEPGRCALFSNVRSDRSGWEPSLRTLLVHSKLDDDQEIARGTRLGRALAVQADRLRAMGADGSDAEVVREALNTVGKVGRLGEQIRCVVSVSMLTEGWDAKCTHVLGYRAFSTQLLCEQVVGRALRRSSYDIGEDGLLPAEFAEVLGVPFDFLRPTRQSVPPVPPKPTYEVRTVLGRQDLRIEFPNIVSYRLVQGSSSLRLAPARVQPFSLEGAASMAETGGMVGEEGALHAGPDDPRRQQAEVALATELVRAIEQRLLDQGDEARRIFLFRGALADVQCWIDLPQVRAASGDAELWPRLASSSVARTRAVHAILDASMPAAAIAGSVVGIFDDPELRSTHGVGYVTSLENHYPTSLNATAERSELNIAPCHSGLEVEIATLLDQHPYVTAWARNYGLGWTIPYLYDDTWRRYEPDFVARVSGDHEQDDVYLLIEGKGAPDEESAAKQRYVEDYWIPAVRNSSLSNALRRWSFAQIPDSYEAYQAQPSLLATDLHAAVSRARRLTAVTEGAH